MGIWLLGHQPSLTQLIDSKIFLLYGSLFLILAAASYLLVKNDSSLGQQISVSARQTGSQKPLLVPSDWFWVSAAMVIAVVARLTVLKQPIGYDEAFTLLNFVNLGWIDVFYYTLPNNHVLFSLIAHITWPFSGDALITARLIALVVSVVSIPMAFVLARKLEAHGLITLVGMALLPYLVFFGGLARGYSMMVFLLLALALLVQLEHPKQERWLAMALVSALALFTMPSALFGVASIVAWALFLNFRKPSDWRDSALHFLLPYGLAVSSFTLLLYTPVIIASGSVDAIINNRFVQPLSWSAFLGTFFSYSEQMLTGQLRDISIFFMPIAAIGILLALAQRTSATLLLGLIAGSLAILLLSRTHPFTRTWVYLLPFLLVAADCGWSRITGWLPAKLKPTAIWTVSGFCLVTLGWQHTQIQYVQYPDIGPAPEAEKLAMEYAINSSPVDVVCVHNPIDAPFLYYFRGKLVSEQPRSAASENQNIWLIKKTDADASLQKMPAGWRPDRSFKGTCFQI